MYKPQIKEKFALTDLSRFGTRARKSVHPDVLIGDHPPFPMFREGDILDANGTLNLIGYMCDREGAYKELLQRLDSIDERIEEIEDVTAKVQELEDKHDRDVAVINNNIANIDNELQEFALRFVYDGLEENLYVNK